MSPPNFSRLAFIKCAGISVSRYFSVVAVIMKWLRGFVQRPRASKVVTSALNRSVGTLCIPPNSFCSRSHNSFLLPVEFKFLALSSPISSSLDKVVNGLHLVLLPLTLTGSRGQHPLVNVDLGYI